MKKIAVVIILFGLIGCKPNNSTNVKITPANQFYKQSEMAALMLLMYDVNLKNKQLILEGKQPANFPKEFLNIHTAKLTDSTDRTPEFNTFAKFYLQTAKTVFNTSKDSLKLSHNNLVNSCIACHQTTCIGPIPKIKKLYIN